MKKTLVVAVFGLLIVLISSLSAASPDDDYRQSILENEKAMDEIYLREYKPSDEIFSDRRNERGEPTPARDFIRPEEAKEIIGRLGLENLDLRQKIETIHSYVLRNFRFVPDYEGEDYWQYPAETIKRGSGDCEDMAFLLVSMLIEAGIPEELVRVNIKNWHAYATVEIGGETIILETDPDPESFYVYDWPQYRWNRQTIERRIRIK